LRDSAGRGACLDFVVLLEALQSVPRRTPRLSRMGTTTMCMWSTSPPARKSQIMVGPPPMRTSWPSAASRAVSRRSCPGATWRERVVVNGGCASGPATRRAHPGDDCAGRARPGDGAKGPAVRCRGRGSLPEGRARRATSSRRSGDPRVRSVVVAATWSAHPQASVPGSGGRRVVGLHAEESIGRVERRGCVDVRQVAVRVDRAVGPRQAAARRLPCCRGGLDRSADRNLGDLASLASFHGLRVTSCPVRQAHRRASSHGWRRVCAVVCPRR